MPFLTGVKLGHSFAASGLFNLEMALAAARTLTANPLPGPTEELRLRHILVNALGSEAMPSLLVSQA